MADRITEVQSSADRVIEATARAVRELVDAGADAMRERNALRKALARLRTEVEQLAADMDGTPDQVPMHVAVRRLRAMAAAACDHQEVIDLTCLGDAELRKRCTFCGHQWTEPR